MGDQPNQVPTTPPRPNDNRGLLLLPLLLLLLLLLQLLRPTVVDMTCFMKSRNRPKSPLDGGTKH